MVQSLAFSPNSKMVASEYGDTMRVWDAANGQVLYVLLGHTAFINTMAFSPDGKQLVSGSDDGSIEVWDAHTGQLKVTLTLIPPQKESTPSRDWIAFTPGGYYDASPGATRFIRWRIENTLYSADRYKTDFHRPDLVQQIF